MKILFHADDYGVSLHASKQIISCVKEGHVQSISVMPNMSCFDEAMELLKEALPHVKVSVHLNVVEGFCVSDKKKIPLLVDEKGLFCLSWGELLVYSFTKPKQLKRQLKIEWNAQIKKVAAYMPTGYKLRLDSHQHPHMIPGIFKALMKLVKEEEYQIEYIRIASERIGPFIRTPALWRTYSVQNIIKNRLLRIFGVYDKYLLKSHPDIAYYDFMGLLFSGKMDENRVGRVLPKLLKKTTQGMEVLFHPGNMRKEEWSEEYNKKEFTCFHFSRSRSIEEKAVKSDLYIKIKDAVNTAS